MNPLRIVDLNAKTTPASDDLLELLDVHDTTDPLASDAQGSNKQVTFANVQTAVLAGLTSAAIDALFSATANTVYAGPTSGPAATPSFRALGKTDLPSAVAYKDAANSFTVSPQTITPDTDTHKGLVITTASATYGASLLEVSNTGIQATPILLVSSGAVTMVATSGLVTAQLNNNTTGTAPNGFVITRRMTTGATDDTGVSLTMYCQTNITTAGGVLPMGAWTYVWDVVSNPVRSAEGYWTAFYTSTERIVLAIGADGTGSKLAAHNATPQYIGTGDVGTYLVAAGFMASFTYTLTSGEVTAALGFTPLGASTVTVSQGGTGDTSLTAYAVLCGGTTSTGAVQSVSGLGTSGYVLTSNGPSALPTWQAAAGGGMAVGGAVTGGGVNRVLYEDGSQNLAATSTFVFTSGTNLGIGTASPNEQLEVAASGGGRFIVSDGGGGSRRVLLLQAPISVAPYARVVAYDYGSGGQQLALNDVGAGKVTIWDPSTPDVTFDRSGSATMVVKSVNDDVAYFVCTADNKSFAVKADTSGVTTVNFGFIDSGNLTVAGFRATNINHTNHAADFIIQQRHTGISLTPSLTLSKTDGSCTLATIDTATNAVTACLTVQHNTTGTAAAGFGTSLVWKLDSSTTANQNAAALVVDWSTATHASRTSEAALQLVNNAAALANALKVDWGAATDDTGLWLYDYTAGSLQRVTRGAAGSGGTGFRLLRVPD